VIENTDVPQSVCYIPPRSPWGFGSHHMKIKRAFTVVAVFLLASSTVFAASSSHSHKKVDADGPGLRSSSALILDAANSNVLYARNPDTPLPIASITKLMTSLVVLDAGLPLDEPIEVTKDDRSVGKGAFSRLTYGAKLTRGDLMHLALMSSENRAAHALGRTYPGGIKVFVAAMNRKAKALGMTRSKFVDPAGLSSENMASPRDLARLVAAAAANPVIRSYSTDEEHTVKVGRQMLEFHNTNTLVKNPEWNIVVQKTGYISEAGQCLVMQAVIDKRNVVMVLLNSFGKYTRVADARRVRKWMESLPSATETRAPGNAGTPEPVRTRALAGTS
jgi:D-alanyl-D-alanine endopeptidase (penicillin-binding protein 7)